MDFQTQAIRARKASTELVSLNRGAKDRALHAMADHLAAAEAELLAANEVDGETARSGAGFAVDG